MSVGVEKVEAQTFTQCGSDYYYNSGGKVYKKIGSTTGTGYSLTIGNTSTLKCIGSDAYFTDESFVATWGIESIRKSVNGDFRSYKMGDEGNTTTLVACGSDAYFVDEGLVDPWGIKSIAKSVGGSDSSSDTGRRGNTNTLVGCGSDAYFTDESLLGNWGIKSIAKSIGGSVSSYGMYGRGNTGTLECIGTDAYFTDESQVATWGIKSIGKSVGGSDRSYDIGEGNTGTLYACSNNAGEWYNDKYKYYMKSNFGSTVGSKSGTTKTCSVPTSASTCSFNPLIYSLTINKTGSGTVTGAGKYSSGTVVTATATPSAGYKFAGWSVDCDTNGKVTMTSAKTCTANFNLAPTYTITFNGNTYTGGTMPTQSIQSGSSANLILNAFTKTGHTFAGWATSVSGAVVYGNGVSYTMGSANVILYAKWTVNTYPVTYNSNGSTGGAVPSNQAKTHDVTLVLALNSGSLVRTGYTFAGWNTLANGLGTNYAEGGNYTANAGVTLYAKWTVNTYTVTFNTNGGDGGSTANQTFTYNTPTPLTANGFTRTGYTFAGWNTLANGSGTNYADTASYTIGAANVILYAKWNSLPIPTVTIIANPPSIIVGTSSLLTWNVTNANSCLSTGAEVLWSGSTTLATSTGSWPTGILNTTGTHTYGITCTGTGGTASATTTVNVGPTPMPTVTISANPSSIVPGTSSFLTWTVTNSTSCVATGETPYWADSDVTLPSVPYPWPTGILNEVRPYVYGITCTGPGGVASATTTVNVTPAIIDNPQVLSGGTNVDKCQAIDVSWDDYPGAVLYDVVCVVGGSNSICSSGTSTSVTIRSLTPDTNYSFIIKAYNSSGVVIASATTASVLSGSICTGTTGDCLISKDVTSPSINNTTTWMVDSTPACPDCTYTWSGTNISSSPAPTSNPFPKIYTTIGLKSINVLAKNLNGSQFCTASATTTVSFTGGTTEER